MDSKMAKKKSTTKIRITQVKSTIDRPQRQKDTMKALGIKKINGAVEVEATPRSSG